MLWVPWQLLQPGASLSPRPAAFPCKLAVYCACSLVWHEPQSTGASFSDLGNSFFASSLWQLAHSSAAWGEALRPAASIGGGTPGTRFPPRGPISWHPAHSSEPGRALGCCPKDGGIPTAAPRTARTNNRRAPRTPRQNGIKRLL